MGPRKSQVLERIYKNMIMTINESDQREDDDKQDEIRERNYRKKIIKDFAKTN